MSKIETKQLRNGIRVVHREVWDSKVSHVGIMLDIGSRDEAAHEQGLAHFWEHMAFKGTEKRKAYHIINRLESLGGELNAYTTKEKICFHASLLANHLDKAVELLADITFHSIFPEKHLEREKGVILEEMAMYRDTPDDAIQDEFDELLFAHHPLGKNILGTEATVRSFRKDDFYTFLNKQLDTEKVVLSSVGPYPIGKLVKMAERYLADVPNQRRTSYREKPDGYLAQRVAVGKPISQAHFMMGLPTIGLQDPDRIPLFFLVNLLGGPGMNSRLNLSLREKYGLVYGADAQYAPYSDVGQVTLYFATDQKNLKRAQRVLLREMDRLKKLPLGSMQLHQAKQQIKGQLAMSEENNNAFMLMMAKSLLDLDRLPDIDELFAEIDGITAEQILTLSQRHLDTQRMSTLTYLAEN